MLNLSIKFELVPTRLFTPRTARQGENEQCES